MYRNLGYLESYARVASCVLGPGREIFEEITLLVYFQEFQVNTYFLEENPTTFPNRRRTLSRHVVPAVILLPIGHKYIHHCLVTLTNQRIEMLPREETE